MAKKKDNNIGKSLFLAAGAVAALAGGYFLYGPEGKSNRKKIKGWTLKAKGEVLSEIEKMKEISKEKYDKTVGKVLNKYSKTAGVTASEIKDLGKELKDHWVKIEKNLPSKQTGKKKAKAKKKSK